MRWCQPHWDKLRTEVVSQGLGSLIPETGEDAARVFQRQVNDGGESIDAFDPLMGAHLAVNSFLGTGHPNGMLGVFMIEGCPICSYDNAHQSECKDERHPKPCTKSIDWCFTDAVQEQRWAWEAMKGGSL